MDRPTNPFDHHHHHGDDSAEVLDPAQESLADALRVSFFLLKVVMLVIVVWYCFFSGMFNVDAQQVGVRLAFGGIVGDTARDQVLMPGGPHYTWPYPFNEVILVSTKFRTLDLDQEFLFEISDANKNVDPHELAAKRRAGPLNPEKDSYVVTGDANIVHLRWSITYSVGGELQGAVFADKVVDWLSNIGDEHAERQIVRAVAERGAVHYAASRSADQLNEGINREQQSRIKTLIQRSLDDLSSGLVVQNVTMVSIVPSTVAEAFKKVSDAETDRASEITKAHKDRTQILNNAAGSAHDQLWALIVDYEKASEGGDDERTTALETKLKNAYLSLNTGESYGDMPILGGAAEIINDAKAYSTQVVEEMRSEGKLFESKLQQYRKSPRFVIAREWQRAMAEILNTKAMIFFIPPESRLVIGTTPDPRQKRMFDQEALDPPAGAGDTNDDPTP